jgi:hypothetical protein
VFKNKGSILAITTGFALVFTMLGLASIYMATLQSETQEKQILSQQAFWLAEAGIQKAIWNLDHGSNTTPETLYPTEHYSVKVTGFGTPNPTVTSIGCVTDDKGNSTFSSCDPKDTNNINIKLIAARQIQVTTKPESLFTHALFADKSINMFSSVKVDGDVGTDTGNIALNSAVTVNGDVSTGPNGTIQKDGSSPINGSTDHNNNVSIPPVIVPPSLSSLTNLGPINISSGGSQTIASGNYHYSSISINSSAKLTINGTVNLYLSSVSNALSITSSSQLVVSPGAQLTLYVDGPVNLASSTAVNNVSKIPANFLLYSTYSSKPGSYGVTISSAGDFYGAIYAPDTDVQLFSSVHFYGALVAQDLKVYSSVDIHYDASLALVGSSFAYAPKTWQEQDVDQMVGG